MHLERRDEPPIIADLPNRWTERCLATPGLQAHIAISKYADHLPLHRQEQIFKIRNDVHLPRNTMSRWMDDVAQSLKLILLCMAEQLFAGDYIQVDETPIKYLKPGSGKAQQGFFWAYSNPKGDVIFDWRTSRGHECLLERLQRPTPDKADPPLYYQGILQCDGYSAYKTLIKKVTGIQLVGCWAHCTEEVQRRASACPNASRLDHQADPATLSNREETAETESWPTASRSRTSKPKSANPQTDQPSPIAL